jgi:hypothetical protein
MRVHLSQLRANTTTSSSSPAVPKTGCPTLAEGWGGLFQTIQSERSDLSTIVIPTGAVARSVTGEVEGSAIRSGPW